MTTDIEDLEFFLERVEFYRNSLTAIKSLFDDKNEDEVITESISNFLNLDAEFLTRYQEIHGKWGNKPGFEDLNFIHNRRLYLLDTLFIVKRFMVLYAKPSEWFAAFIIYALGNDLKQEPHTQEIYRAWLEKKVSGA